jgi:dolichol-phosphate mannosyltransferase
MEGFKIAQAPVLGVMDADLSHPPSLLPALMAALQFVQVDMAIASRYVPGGGCRNWPWRRRALSRAGCFLARPLTPVRDVTSGFFLVRRDAIERTSVSAPGFKICLELLVRSRAISVAEVPYVFTDRAAGESKMTLREAVHYFVQLKDLYMLKWRRRGVKSAAVKHVVLSEQTLRELVPSPGG